MATDLIIVAVAIVLSILLLHPRLTRMRTWRATVTPLASIIGSGFLISGPILADAAGRQAWIAMSALCAIAYVFGAAIRYNILTVEPVLKNKPSLFVRGLERVSDFALAIAYFISVAYYLNLFAAFALRLVNVNDPFWSRCAATVVTAALGAVGGIGGLRDLERLAVSAVGVKLALIAAIVVALVGSSIGVFFAGEFAWPSLDHARGAEEVRTLLGLVIMVQGFETSRYLGEEYDAEMRVKTMRRAQWIATVIYVIFILLTTRFFTDGLPATGGETAIIDMLEPIGAVMAPLIIITALASQSSAAIADLNGAGGLLSETAGKRVSVKLGNILTALAAIAVTWFADIYEIIVYASKAFVIYYALQCLQAANSARVNKRWIRCALYIGGLLVAVCVVLFAIPAEA